MTLPGFSAEASLERAHGVYRGAATGNASGDVRPMTVSATGPWHWPVMRCCGWSSLLGRFVCVSRVRVPWEQCSCTRTPFGPVILCRPIDLSPA